MLLKESAPHLFGSSVAMPAMGGIGRSGARPNQATAGSASGAPLSLTQVAQIKDENARAEALQELMDSERKR
jgi:hypothetical protein